MNANTADFATENMAEHINGSGHRWDFVLFCNQDPLLICYQCRTWKIVPQENYTPTGGIHT